MNLLFIYGPPASGKLTIAEELAKITGYKLFHNHLTQDLAEELYPNFGEVRFGLVDRLRLETFKYAAEKDTNLIFTYVYSGGEDDDKFISQTVEIIKRQGGQVMFIQISAPDDVLLERVNNESRKRFHKLSDVTILSERLRSKKYGHSVDQPNIFKLDSSKQSSEKSAEYISKHFRLSSN